MITKELTDYIKKEIDRGIPKETINELLLKAGWDSPDIEEGFRTVLGQPTPVLPEKLPPVGTPPLLENPILAEIKSPASPDIKIRKKISLKSVATDIALVVVVAGLVYVFGDKINAWIKTLTAEKPVVTSVTVSPPPNNLVTASATTTVEDNVHDSVDFVVSDVRVIPDPPKVNSPETQIAVIIKNQGTTSSETAGVTATAEIIGSNLKPIKGGVSAKIRAGESATWIFRPYAVPTDASTTEKIIPDLPGRKTLKITLNPDKTALELDYSNDSFSKKIDFVE